MSEGTAEMKCCGPDATPAKGPSTRRVALASSFAACLLSTPPQRSESTRKAKRAQQFAIKLSHNEAVYIADLFLEYTDVPSKLENKFAELLTKFEKAERYLAAVERNSPPPRHA